MDYNMRLTDRGGALITLLEYKHFRMTGNGFDFKSEEEQDIIWPNNSLISSLVTHKDGNRLSRRGYWGDIVTGPFLPFGHEFQTEVRSV